MTACDPRRTLNALVSGRPFLPTPEPRHGYGQHATLVGADVRALVDVGSKPPFVRESN